MINVPVNVILLWLGTNAAIPAGFSRVTALDGKFIKGANGDTAGATGGAATHTHTSPSHTHDIATHQHTYTIPNLVNPVHDRRLPNPANGNTTEQSHTHNGTTGNNAQPGTSGGAAVTYGAMSNNPPYTELIFISGDGAHPIPDGAIMLFASNALPANYAQAAALNNKFLKGAAGAGNAGGTGGSNTNVHDIGHGHTAGSHDHGATTSSNDLNYTHYQTTAVRDFTTDHNHTFTPSATSVAVNNFVGSLTCPEVVEPLFKKLMAIQATGADLLPGVIGLWLGAIADIPSGWNLCNGLASAIDMRNFHLKIANDATEINATGGSNTHTHAAQPHSHTASAHNHAVNIQLSHTSDTYNGQLTDDLAGYSPLTSSMNHDVFNLDNASANYQNANTTADAANNEPPYKTVHFIMFGKIYTQIQKPFSYKLRQTRQIQKPFRYAVQITNRIVVPFSYEIARVIWSKVPKPDFP